MWAGLTATDVLFHLASDNDKDVLCGAVAYLDRAAGVGLDHVISALLDLGLHGELLLQGSEATGSRRRHLVPLTRLCKVLLFLR